MNLSTGRLLAATLCLGFATAYASAQSTPAASPSGQQNAADQSNAAPAAPASALPTPSITGPLQSPPPADFDAGPFGKISVNGILSGMGMWQGNHVPGDNPTQAALDNGQIWIQKTDGWFQFYIQAGAYTLPALATPFVSTGKTLDDFYGPVPVAYLKLQAGKNTSFEIGSLPTLIGAEYTFSFENVNIERGLLWNQESAVSRGVQVNQTMGKFAASLSWNDGFYSNRYTWLTGSLAYTNGPHTVSFIGGGNYNNTGYLTAATPLQNDSQIYNVIYTYTKGAWIVQPYWQYTAVPANAKFALASASTNGGALLLSHAFKHGFSLAGRYEYIGSSGSVAQNSPNLIFGPGSSGTSVTATPTFQYGGFFFRGDLSWVHASSITPGDAFGHSGANKNQPRAVAEIGFIFGNNLIEKK